MKTIILTDVFFPDTTGGAGRLAYHIAMELGIKGHTVNIITRNFEKKLPEHQALLSNVCVDRFNTPTGESFSLLLFEIIKSYYLSRKISRQKNFDIVCIHQSMAAIGPLFNKIFSNLPIIYYYHSPWHEEFLAKKYQKSFLRKNCFRMVSNLMQFIEKKTIDKSSIVITLSQYMRDRLVGLHGCSDDKIKIIPGGIDLSLFSLNTQNKNEIRKREDIPPDKVVFLSVRNLVRRMGLENLIEAFHQSSLLQEKSVLLIGGKGPLENHLKSIVSRYDLGKTVRFAGHIPEKELPEYYQAADYFVLPTEKLEGFGLVILESLACGTPVIGTPVGAIPELIGKFDNRLLTRGTGPSEIKEKLEEVLADPDEYNFDQQSCRKFTEDNYSWKKVADEFERIALDLIKQ